MRTTTPPLIGCSLAHYRVIKKLGKGGMGEVYLAEDGRLGRRVALKILAPALASNPLLLARFHREARSVAALNHPNIVTIYSVEEIKDLYFLVMELIEGLTLAERIPRQGMAWDEILEIALPIVEALEAAHGSGIIHRDLKTRNIMVTDEGRVKVLDFGIAKFSRTDDANSSESEIELTKAGVVLGTIPYTSPEQLLGRPVDHRTDIFSLGVILYEMATGMRPFQGKALTEVMAAILNATPPSLTSTKRDFPPDFDEIIARCLAKDPIHRYEHTSELHRALLMLASWSGEAIIADTLNIKPDYSLQERLANVDSAARPVTGVRLPALPRCFGREPLVQEIVEALCSHPLLPVPVLGPAGAGKTTVTLVALHNQYITQRFGKRRFFIRCESVSSPEALIGEIARCVCPDIGPPLKPRLLDDLERAPSVLALDNFETVWEGDTAGAEELLCELAAIQGLAIVVSLRGEQRPLGPSWREAIHVTPLAPEAARSAFLAVAGERYRDDPNLDALLAAVDYLPLAVVLLASQAEGEPHLSVIRQRWQEQRTALLQRAGGRERLQSVEVSLQLSFDSPRMNSASRRLLSLLGLLPSGIAWADLDTLLPGHGTSAAAVLRKVGFAFDQDRRLRTLAPVREYIHRHYPPRPGDLERALDHYLDLARLAEKIGGEGGAEAVRRLSPEWGNLEGGILEALARPTVIPAIRSALTLAEFVRFTGLGSLVVLERARQVAQSIGEKELAADCIRKLGSIALYRSDYTGARGVLEEALDFYRESGSVQGEASCLLDLGYIALYQSRVDVTVERFQTARQMFRQVGDTLGEGECELGLGFLATYRGEFNAARSHLEQGLILFQRIGYTRGEANCLQRLAEVSLEMQAYDTARLNLEQALLRFRRIGSIQGEASCIRKLGDLLALCGTDYSTARERFEEALMLYRRVGSLLGEANCIRRIGDMALAVSDLPKAHSCFETATQIFRRIGDALGEANCVEGLGIIAVGSNPVTARSHFYKALELYNKIPHPDSICSIHLELARTFPKNSQERRLHVEAARQVWESIAPSSLTDDMGQEIKALSEQNPLP